MRSDYNSIYTFNSEFEVSANFLNDGSSKIHQKKMISTN